MATARVIYHFEDGTWWAESPDLARWSAAAPELEDLVRLVLEGASMELGEDVEIEHRPDLALMPAFQGRTLGGRARVSPVVVLRIISFDGLSAGVGSSMVPA